MALLPQIDYPDVNRTLANYSTGYALGQDQRKQNALAEAGQLMARNDQTGARNALYNAGQMSEGLQIDDRMRAAARQARDDQLAKAKRSNEVLANMALLADTPEKWAVVIGNAKRAGLQVDNWADFGTRDYVLAQGGKVREFLDMELKERALAAKQAAAARPKPRTLSFGDTQKLAEEGSHLENVKRYGEQFSDDFAGYGTGGDTTMAIARNFPVFTGEKTEKAAAFWQDYDRYKNQVRNKLFGSALTAPEKEAFEKADVNPNMDPKLIRQNLARQKAATISALGKTARSLVASGYTPEAVEGALGVSLQDLGVQPPQGAAGSGGGSLGVGSELDEAGLQGLPEGAVIRDESGQRYMRQGDQLVPVD